MTSLRPMVRLLVRIVRPASGSTMGENDPFERIGSLIHLFYFFDGRDHSKRVMFKINLINPDI